MLHNLTPARGARLPHVGHRLRPGLLARRREHPGRRAAVARRRRGHLPRLRRAARLGQDGRYTFPDDARGAERRKIGSQQRITMPEDVTLVAAGGHVHPGGLYVDLKAVARRPDDDDLPLRGEVLRAGGRRSWDASMTFTKPGLAGRHPQGRRAERLGDVRHLARVVVRGHGDHRPALVHDDADRRRARSVRAGRSTAHGEVTHGHLPENDNHGGTGRATTRRRPPAAVRARRPARVDIKSFVYALGDLSSSGAKQRPPTVRPGGTLTFRNLDSPRGQDPATAIYHTITACKAPCNKSTGIAYPLADASRPFDSGELGFGPRAGDGRREPRDVEDAEVARARHVHATSAACTRSCAARFASSGAERQRETRSVTCERSLTTTASFARRFAPAASARRPAVLRAQPRPDARGVDLAAQPRARAPPAACRRRRARPRRAARGRRARTGSSPAPTSPQRPGDAARSPAPRRPSRPGWRPSGGRRTRRSRRCTPRAPAAETVPWTNFVDGSAGSPGLEHDASASSGRAALKRCVWAADT